MKKKKILANLAALQHLWFLKAYVWGKVEVLVALGRGGSFLTSGPCAFPISLEGLADSESEQFFEEWEYC